jgi:hypothetical protein
LRREGVDWASGHAELIAAACANLRGQPEQAVKALRASLEGFDAVDMRLQAACTRHRLGELLGGDEGRELMGDARLWLMQQRVANPERMIDAVAPGLGKR